MKYNDSYPPSSVIHLTFPARGNMPPVKLHWYDGGLLPERPDELEPERRLPESGTIFVGDKGKMWCETYSESPRLIPESAMTGVRASGRRRRCRAFRADAMDTRRTGSTRFGRRGRRCRTSTTPVRSPKWCCSATSRCASPARGSMWDAAEHEGDQRRRGEPVRAAQLPQRLDAADVAGVRS